MKNKKINNYLLTGFTYCLPELSELLSQNGSVISISAHSASEYNIFNLFKKKYPLSIDNTHPINKNIDLNIFKEMYSRHWYPVVHSDEEALSSMNYYINFFTVLLEQNNITIVVFQNIPHEGPDYVLYKLAKMLGLKTIIFFQSLFSGYSFCGLNMNDLFNRPSMEIEKDKISKELFLDVFNKNGNWFYMAKTKKINFFIVDILKNTKTYFRKKLHLYPTILRDIFVYHRSYTKLYNKQLFTKKNQKYIYFPLHLQPELTTSALGKKYTNQAIALKKLRSLIPIDIFIVVKENPKQTPFKRNHAFFEQISKIDNLQFASRDTNSIELIKNSLAVATVTGTAGWEAYTISKPVITFGQAWYNKLPGVHNINIFNWPDVINHKIQPKDKLIEESFKLIKNNTYRVICDIAYKRITKNFSMTENTHKIFSLIKQHQAINEK